MASWQLILIETVLFGGLFLLMFLLLLRHRSQQMLHLERMAAIEKGADVAAASRQWSPRVYLLRGLIWTFAGIGLCVSLLGLVAASSRPVSVQTEAWRAKSVSETLGIPVDQARRLVAEEDARHPDGMSPGIALLSLIPLGVGLAYLLYYASDPARKTAVARRE